MSPELAPVSVPIDPFIQTTRSLRVAIKSCGADIKSLQHEFSTNFEVPPEADAPEVHANLTLAFRHLEDSAMRLGKAIQAYDGGKSVYDK